MASRIRARALPWWAAVRLGWAIESNWADPFVFMTYQIVRPLFGALILAVMFKVVTGQPSNSPGFANLYVGNAFFILVVQLLSCLGLVIVEDRERFEMIRYIYLAPVGLGTYLTARAAGRLAATAASILFTLLVGSWVFGIGYRLPLSELPYLGMVVVLGGIATLALGVMMAGATLALAHHGYSMPEGVSGVLFLLCGVVFPIDILPSPIAVLGKALPWTYWLEALRRTLLGASYLGSLKAQSDITVLLLLAATTTAVVVLSWAALRGAQWIAVATGKLDQKTDH